MTSASNILACSQCSAIRTAGKPCPECGFLPKRRGEYLQVIDGDLQRIERDGRQHPNAYTPEQKREFHRMLVYLAIERGNKIGAAAHRFKDRFGHWPLDRQVEPLKPNAEVIAWDRHCRIAYAKAMQKAAANG